MKGSSAKAARRHKGLSQDEVARKIGITQPRLSLVERGHSYLTPGQRRKLHRALALGDRTEDEKYPWFVLAEIRTDRDVRLIFDEQGRIAVFRQRGLAENVLHLLELGNFEADVVPTWLSFVVEAALRHGVSSAQDAIFLVDEKRSDRETALTVLEHAASLLRGEGETSDAVIEIARAIRASFKDRAVAKT